MLDLAYASVGASRLLWGMRHYDGDRARQAARARIRGAVSTRMSSRMFAGATPRASSRTTRSRASRRAASPRRRTDAHARVGAMIDVNCFIGAYPFRELPHPDPDVLVRVLAREGIDGGVGWTFAHRVSSRRHRRERGAVRRARAASRGCSSPCRRFVPTGRTGSARSRTRTRAARARFAPIRMQWGMGAHDPATSRARARVRRDRSFRSCSRRASRMCASDSALDSASDLSGAHIRAIVRADPRRARGRDGGGSRAHRGSRTGDSRPTSARGCGGTSRGFGDRPRMISRTCCARSARDRFLFGSAWPLRLVQSPIANLELLPRSCSRCSGRGAVTAREGERAHRLIAVGAATCAH